MDNRASFFNGLNEFLSEDGVLALHVPGDVRAVDLPIPNEHGVRAGIHSERQEAVVKDLDQLGFKEMKEYEEVSASKVSEELSACFSQFPNSNFGLFT